MKTKKKKDLHFRNPQNSAGSTRLVYHKALYIAGFKVKTKKRRLHFGNPHISEGLLSHFLLLRMALCIYHSLRMSAKRNQATQKNFQATQLWVATHRLRTIDLQ